MEELFYWIIEYCKVMFGFGFLMFIWPMVVFRKYLAGKSATFRFSFCVVEQLVLINTVVLVLGLAKLLNEWTIYILFYGTFLFSLRKHFALTKERRKKLRYLVNGSFGWRNFLFLERRKLVRSVEKFFKRLCEFYKKHWLEYTLLIVAIVYGMIYFTWGVFHEHSYPFSDMYVHHSWAYELSQGVPFSNGIYPQGLHCFIYSLSTLFGIRMYSCVLFMASANAAITLVAIYCLLKELFRWRFSAVFTLIAMLTFGEMGRYLLISMARFQCALPQEMAFSSIFICCLYLMKYLKGGLRAIRKGKETKGFWDENLLVFMLALAATIVFHFYATFMAFFMCVGVALFLWKRIFTKERFLPLITAVLFSLFISVAPMATGYATGIELEHSLLWAMSVMEESVESEEAGVQENISNAINTPDGTLTEEEGLNAGAETGGTSEKTPEVSIFEKIGKKLLSVGTAALNKCKYICSIIYTETYPEMYGPDVVVMILLTMGIVLFGGSIGAFFLFCVEKMKKVSIERPAYGGYFIIIYAALVYVLIYSSEFLGWPVLLERYRIGFICNLMNIAVVMISADILFCMGKRALEEQGLKIFSV
ncbi:MAG: hypothetical protein IJ274_14440, partial [Lachnospiraceae bacterium]|nr:hypothetical protein [Lachnospiraceae bacterium]